LPSLSLLKVNVRVLTLGSACSTVSTFSVFSTL